MPGHFRDQCCFFRNFEVFHRLNKKETKPEKRPSFHLLFSSGFFTSLRDIFLLFLASLLTPTAAFVMSPLCYLEKWPP